MARGVAEVRFIRHSSAKMKVVQPARVSGLPKPCRPWLFRVHESYSFWLDCGTVLGLMGAGFWDRLPANARVALLVAWAGLSVIHLVTDSSTPREARLARGLILFQTATILGLLFAVTTPQVWVVWTVCIAAACLFATLSLLSVWCEPVHQVGGRFVVTACLLPGVLGAIHLLYL